MAPEPRRTFLGWSGPLLEKAADWIRAEHGDALGDVVVCLSGARAGRKLRELLARRAAADWEPPRILTPGRLIDDLVRLEGPVAGRLARTLAWERALRSLPRAQLESIVAEAPRDADRSAWVRLAELVRKLHGELAPEGIDFEALARGDGRPPHAGEVRRFEALAAAQARWRELLEELGVLDPHEARFAAIAAGEVDARPSVVLVGVVDLQHLLRRLLERIAGNVSVLVLAPESLAAGFDAFGALRTAFWKERDVDLPVERWHVVEKPVDQADRLVDVMAAWGGRFAPEEISIGLADDEVAPFIDRRLASFGVRARFAAGTPVARTPPARLLGAATRFLAQRDFMAFAALVRHPDVERAVRARARHPEGKRIARADEYQRGHLPDEVTGEWLGGTEASALRSMHGALLEVLGELAGARPRHLAAWTRAIRAFLLAVYGSESLDPEVEEERVLAAALAHCDEVLSRMEELPEALVRSRMRAADALELATRELRALVIPPAPPVSPALGAAEIDVLGMLELPLDDARALVLVGFNEGRVPETIHGHAFLPDGVRARIGLATNEDRLARDLYALQLLLHSRDTYLVSGRRSAVGDPLVPSRLAFHAPRAQVLERVRRFLPCKGRREPARESDAASVATALPVLDPVPVLDGMGVTWFRDYLQSPYLFYLRRVLRLETLDDREREMSPLVFGSLVHDVLEAFGKDAALRDSTDERAIGELLFAQLDLLAAGRFGAAPLPAVAIQLERLRYRFARFAAWQVGRVRAGWRIVHCEWAPEGGAVAFPVDGVPIALRGRIDRIDRHEPSGRWAVLDYKTGETASTPEKTHRRGGRGPWIDLQLPLYAWLVTSLGLDAVPALGYVALGKDEHEVGERMARWSEADLLEAFETAREVVRKVRAGEFRERGNPRAREEILRAILGEGLLASEDQLAGAEA